MQDARPATNRAQDARPDNHQRAGCTPKLGRVRTALLVLALAALPLELRAQRESLGRVDYVLWGASSALVVVDWGQTHALVAQGESNPLLGRHPSHGAVNRYMVSVLAANALVSRIHGWEWRRVIWAFVAGAELDYFARFAFILPFTTSPFAYCASNVPFMVLPL